MKAVCVFLFLVLTPPVFGTSLKDMDCVATALATADPSNAVGEAISNAVAQAFNRVITCESDQENSTGEPVSSLAVSVAVAIASSESAGAGCVAEADAVAEVVSDVVTQGMTGGLLENVNPVQQTLAEAWLVEEAASIEARLKEGVNASAMGPEACTVAVLDSLSTAQDVSNAMEDAISQILHAVQCGDNREEEDPEASPLPITEPIISIDRGFDISSVLGPQPLVGPQPFVKPDVIEVQAVEPNVADCRYDSKLRKFFGRCKASTTGNRRCNEEFRRCKNQGRPARTCRLELNACSTERLSGVVSKGAREEEPAPKPDGAKRPQPGGGIFNRRRRRSRLFRGVGRSF